MPKSFLEANKNLFTHWYLQTQPLRQSVFESPLVFVVISRLGMGNFLTFSHMYTCLHEHEYQTSNLLLFPCLIKLRTDKYTISPMQTPINKYCSPD